MPRPLDVVRLGWGLLLVMQARRLVRVAGARPTPLAANVARALGVRHILEAVALTAAAQPRIAALRLPGAQRLVRRGAAGADALHAASAVGLAAVTEQRRAWITDAAVAGTFTLLTWQSAS